MYRCILNLHPKILEGSSLFYRRSGNNRVALLGRFLVGRTKPGFAFGEGFSVFGANLSRETPGGESYCTGFVCCFDIEAPWLIYIYINIYMLLPLLPA